MIALHTEIFSKNVLICYNAFFKYRIIVVASKSHFLFYLPLLSHLPFVVTIDPQPLPRSHSAGLQSQHPPREEVVCYGRRC